MLRLMQKNLSQGWNALRLSCCSSRYGVAKTGMGGMDEKGTLDLTPTEDVNKGSPFCGHGAATSVPETHLSNPRCTVH